MTKYNKVILSWLWRPEVQSQCRQAETKVLAGPHIPLELLGEKLALGFSSCWKLLARGCFLHPRGQQRSIFPSVSVPFSQVPCICISSLSHPLVSVLLSAFQPPLLMRTYSSWVSTTVKITKSCRWVSQGKLRRIFQNDYYWSGLIRGIKELQKQETEQIMNLLFHRNS